MAKSVLLKEDIDAAGVFVQTLLNLGFPVRVAAWVRMDTDCRWHLYIASPNVEKHGPLSVYRFFLRVLREMLSASLTTFDINDVHAANTTNHFVNRFANRAPPGMLVDGLFLYVVNKKAKPWSRKGRKVSASEVTKALQMPATLMCSIGI